MPVFDQRGQKVTYQYNAAGDINFGNVQNRADLISELKKLKDEISKAGEAEVIDAEIYFRRS
jgi:myo-inositol-1-phosphate synthase